MGAESYGINFFAVNFTEQQMCLVGCQCCGNNRLAHLEGRATVRGPK